MSAKTFASEYDSRRSIRYYQIISDLSNLYQDGGMHGSRSPAVFVLFFIHTSVVFSIRSDSSTKSLEMHRLVLTRITDHLRSRSHGRFGSSASSRRSIRSLHQLRPLVDDLSTTWLGVLSSHGATGSEFWSFDGWDSLEVSLCGDLLVFDHLTMTLRGIADISRCRSA